MINKCARNNLRTFLTGGQERGQEHYKTFYHWASLFKIIGAFLETTKLQLDAQEVSLKWKNFGGSLLAQWLHKKLLCHITTKTILGFKLFLAFKASFGSENVIKYSSFQRCFLSNFQSNSYMTLKIWHINFTGNFFFSGLKNLIKSRKFDFPWNGESFLQSFFMEPAGFFLLLRFHINWMMERTMTIVKMAQSNLKFQSFPFSSLFYRTTNLTWAILEAEKDVVRWICWNIFGAFQSLI